MSGPFTHSFMVTDNNHISIRVRFKLHTHVYSVYMDTYASPPSLEYESQTTKPFFSSCAKISIYREVSNLSRTLVGNKIVDHSDVVGASPVGAAPTTSSFST